MFLVLDLPIPVRRLQQVATAAKTMTNCACLWPWLALYNVVFALPCYNGTSTCEFKTFALGNANTFMPSRAACTSRGMFLVTPMGVDTLNVVRSMCNSTFFALVHPSSNLTASAALPSPDACRWEDIDDPTVHVMANDTQFWSRCEPDGGGNFSGKCSEVTQWNAEPCSAFYLCGEAGCPIVADIPCFDLGALAKPKCVVCAKRRNLTAAPTTTTAATSTSTGATNPTETFASASETDEEVTMTMTTRTTRTTTASESAVSMAAPRDDDSIQIHVGTIVGVVVGVVVFLVLLVVLVAIGWRRRFKSASLTASDVGLPPAATASTYGTLPTRLNEYDDAMSPLHA